MKNMQPTYYYAAGYAIFGALSLLCFVMMMQPRNQSRPQLHAIENLLIFIPAHRLLKPIPSSYDEMRFEIQSKPYGYSIMVRTADDTEWIEAEPSMPTRETAEHLLLSVREQLVRTKKLTRLKDAQADVIFKK